MTSLQKMNSQSADVPTPAQKLIRQLTFHQRIGQAEGRWK
jgi:hypothetical protein